MQFFDWFRNIFTISSLHQRALYYQVTYLTDAFKLKLSKHSYKLNQPSNKPKDAMDLLKSVVMTVNR